MLPANDFSKFEPLIDRLDPDFPNLHNVKHYFFKGWLRGDSPIESFKNVEAIPERSDWGRPMVDSSMLVTLGLDTKFSSVKKLFQELVKFTNDSGVLKSAFAMEVMMKIRFKNDVYDCWYVLTASSWNELKRAEFAELTGLTPQKITNNVWMMHRAY